MGSLQRNTEKGMFAGALLAGASPRRRRPLVDGDPWFGRAGGIKSNCEERIDGGRRALSGLLDGEGLEDVEVVAVMGVNGRGGTSPRRLLTDREESGGRPPDGDEPSPSSPARRRRCRDSGGSHGALPSSYSFFFLLLYPPTRPLTVTSPLSPRMRM